MSFKAIFDGVEAPMSWWRRALANVAIAGLNPAKKERRVVVKLAFCSGFFLCAGIGDLLKGKWVWFVIYLAAFAFWLHAAMTAKDEAR